MVSDLTYNRNFMLYTDLNLEKFVNAASIFRIKKNPVRVPNSDRVSVKGIRPHAGQEALYELYRFKKSIVFQFLDTGFQRGDLSLKCFKLKCL